VALTYAVTRMRNGKHESNSVSRFVKEIDRQYVANPLREEGQAFGSSSFLGSYQSSKSAYGSSSSQVRPFPSGGSTTRFSRNQTSSSSRPSPSRQASVPPRPQKPAAPADPDFIPVSALLLKAGQRIEHNRFGLGKILEISGGPEDLKARISFDNFGEKILLLKYAKIRFPKD